MKILEMLLRRIGIRSERVRTNKYQAIGFPGFDYEFYLSRNLDVREAGVDPKGHFMTFGWQENRDPSRGFSVAAYLDANPDVREAGVNPLVHYVEFGMAEGRSLRASEPLTRLQIQDSGIGGRIDRFHRADPTQRARIV